jgi:hypothetical protein
LVFLAPLLQKELEPTREEGGEDDDRDLEGLKLCDGLLVVGGGRACWILIE